MTFSVVCIVSHMSTFCDFELDFFHDNSTSGFYKVNICDNFWKKVFLLYLKSLKTCYYPQKF